MNCESASILDLHGDLNWTSSGLFWKWILKSLWYVGFSKLIWLGLLTLLLERAELVEIEKLFHVKAKIMIIIYYMSHQELMRWWDLKKLLLFQLWNQVNINYIIFHEGYEFMSYFYGELYARFQNKIENFENIFFENYFWVWVSFEKREF